MVLLFNRRAGLLLDEPGVVAVQVVYWSSERRGFKTEPMDVRVRAPERPEDEVAWAAIRENLKAYGILIHVPYQTSARGWSLTQENREFFEAFLDEHGESRYAQHVALSLGRHFMAIAGRRDGVEGVSPADARDSARRHLAWAASRGSHAWLRDQARSWRDELERQ